MKFERITCDLCGADMRDNQGTRLLLFTTSTFPSWTPVSHEPDHVCAECGKTVHDAIEVRRAIGVERRSPPAVGVWVLLRRGGPLPFNGQNVYFAQRGVTRVGTFCVREGHYCFQPGNLWVLRQASGYENGITHWMPREVPEPPDDVREDI